MSGRGGAGRNRRLEPAQFIQAYRRIVTLARRSLRDYLKDPNEENTHDFRVAMRRLKLSTELVPKKVRPESLRRCRKGCRRILALTSRIRDIDIINQAFAGQNRGGPATGLFEGLSREREKQVRKSAMAARKFSGQMSVQLTKKDAEMIGKRFKDSLDGLFGDIGTRLPTVMNNEGKVDDLHSLRKDFRRLRYLMELLPEVARATKAFEDLGDLQDMLGKVRDSDVVLGFLVKSGHSEEDGSLIQTQRELRHSRYRTFVKQCSARAHSLGLEFAGTSTRQ